MEAKTVVSLLILLVGFVSLPSFMSWCLEYWPSLGFPEYTWAVYGILQEKCVIWLDFPFIKKYIQVTHFKWKQHNHICVYCELQPCKQHRVKHGKLYFNQAQFLLADHLDSK